jgi:hypothetical protein
MTDDDVARHEAAHAAMAITLGVGVKAMGRDPNGGYVEYDAHSHTHQGAIHRMMILLAALAETAATGDDLPDWPINPDHGNPCTRHDRQLLAALADRVGLTEREYRRLLITTLRLTCTREYQLLVTAASGRLDYTPTISRDDLAQLVTLTERH